jgi:exonuclease VII small subunit
MSHPLVEKAKVELEQAQSQLDVALRTWDASVSELWRTSLALTQAQKRVTHAHELLRNALDAVGQEQKTQSEHSESASGG